jgi:two-component system chemotaxis sensor kinase CheA
VGFDIHTNLFVEESLEILDKIESPLMYLIENPDRHDLVDEVFRALHTIKGSGSMFGYTDIVGFVHDIETAFDDIRTGNASISRDIIDLTLAAKDRIRELLLHNDSEDEKKMRDDILNRLSLLTGHVKNEDTAESLSIVKGKSAQMGERKAWLVRFAPSREILLRGVLVQPILDELRSLGECSISVNTSCIPDIDNINPEHLYMSWDIDLTTDRPVEDIKAVFIFVEDFAEISIKENDNPPAYPEPAVSSELKLNGAGTVSPDGKSGVRPVDGIGKDLHVFERRKADVYSIRVKNEKLDTLMNLVGELVTLHARLNQEAVNSKNSEFIAIAEAVGRLTDELRDNTMNIRMVPLSEMFTNFIRLVYDLSNKLGKKIKLITSGEQTELDKNVIEDLRDPLMHIIRNAADHGIESPDERRRKGKNETGVISLTAEYSGSNVIIHISEDGRGLDRDKIRTLAVERGLMGSGEIDDNTIYRMIFEPGFSTTKAATDISGRGVGMDVVKRNIEKLRGTIDIKTNFDKGTELILTIPLTLAIIDGFMFEMGGNLFVFNLSAVRECVEYSRSDFSDRGEQFTINIRGELVPCIDLVSLFEISSSIWGFSKIIIIDYNGERYGFLVDRIIGKYQSVIKPLGRGAKTSDMIAGATILGDGSVALLLDIGAIIKHTSGQ